MNERASIDRDRWARVSALFHHARTLPLDERISWLTAECGGDAALLEEVVSLLDADSRAGSFIDRPAFVGSVDESSAPPKRIGPYRIVDELGRGGMAVVYLAEDERLGRLVALKAVAPAFVDDHTRIERLRTEARAAAALRHPNIATVYTLEDIDGRWYMATEYLRGETLREALSRGAFELTQVVDIALELARALAAAHERGVVHRDLKPENIMRTDEGVVKIVDFGLARIVDPVASSASLTADGTVLGTPAYMSPEQIRGREVDARSDLFSLGVVIHELATGHHPFQAHGQAAVLARILEETPDAFVPSTPAHRTDLAADVARIVTRCLAKTPAERFQSAGEIAEALEALRRGETVLSGPTIDAIGSPRPSPSPRTRWWWQFHQAAATISYLLLLIPLWHLRDLTVFGPNAGFFVAGLIAAVAAGALRLHLWFALGIDPSHWIEQHYVSRRWLRAADVAFSLVLLGEGVTAIHADDPAAVLLVAAAAAVTVSYVIVEPATTRSAFGPGQPPHSPS